MIRVFIGYDKSETVAFHVLAHSIVMRSSEPVSVTGLVLNQLPLWRERDERQSTDFAFSRFLVPSMCAFKGWAIFMDCDMLCLGDIKELYDLRDDRYAVQVVKHNHVPRESEKFLGNVQLPYEKKNWSSVMLFNNALCPVLTPEYVNNASGLDLHQFRWLGSDELIGGLPSEWNHLVGYDEPKPAKLVHFTLGTPCFKKYRFCEYSKEWFEESDRMLHYDRTGEFSRPDKEVI